MYKIILFSILLFPSNVFGDTWVHFDQVVDTPEIQIKIINNNQPKYIPQNVYQWVPYVTNEPIIIEKRCLFIKKYEVEYRPVTRWALRPIVIMP